MCVVYSGGMVTRLIFLVVLLASSATAAELHGRVVSIADGDTFTLLTPGKDQVKIRVAEIDAPESGQPYGNKAKQALSELARNWSAAAQRFFSKSAAAVSLSAGAVQCKGVSFCICGADLQCEQAPGS